MAIMLPGELDWVLDLLGYEWPNIDEDKLFDCAQAWRDFAAAVRATEAAGAAAANVVTATNSGQAIDAFGEHWGKFTGGFGHDSYLTDAATAAEVIAVAFDAAALAVIAGKVAVIAQLITLAIEIIAAQAAAPFTFGLSELGALGATQATRLIVRRILDKLKTEVVEAATKAAQDVTMETVKKMAIDFAKDQIREAVVEGAKDAAKEAGTEIAQNLAQQGIEQHFNARDGFDLSQPVQIVQDKAGDYVDGIADLADPAAQAEALANRPADLLEERFEEPHEREGDDGSRSDGEQHAGNGQQPRTDAPPPVHTGPVSKTSDSLRADFG